MTFSLGDLAAKWTRSTLPRPPQKSQDLKTKQSVYYRRTSGWRRFLSHRRVYEEALDALKLVKPENVVDPAAYLFHRAVAEHSMSLKDDATRSIIRLLDDAAEVPERYKTVAVLMAFDMQAWREKDLSDIARKMDNIERRLELARGGPKTQKMQKDVVSRLDEIIKQLENQQKGDSSNAAALMVDKRATWRHACSPGAQHGRQEYGPGNRSEKLDGLQTVGQVARKGNAQRCRS